MGRPLLQLMLLSKGLVASTLTYTHPSLELFTIDMDKPPPELKIPAAKPNSLISLSSVNKLEDKDRILKILRFLVSNTT